MSEIFTHAENLNNLSLSKYDFKYPIEKTVLELVFQSHPKTLWHLLSYNSMLCDFGKQYFQKYVLKDFGNIMIVKIV